MTDCGFRGNAGSSSSAIKLRIYFWNPSLLLDAAAMDHSTARLNPVYHNRLVALRVNLNLNAIVLDLRGIKRDGLICAGSYIVGKGAARITG